MTQKTASKKNGTKLLDTSTPMFEVPTVRLSIDETRTILRVSQGNGKPVDLHFYGGEHPLIALGVLRKIVRETTPTENEVYATWRKLKAAAIERSYPAATHALTKISQLTKKTTKTGYVLTDLGKQLARGISVRMAARS